MKRPRIRFYGEDTSNVEIGAWIGIARKRIAHLREYVVPEGTPVFTQRLAFEEARIDLIIREDGLDDITIRMLPRATSTIWRGPRFVYSIFPSSFGYGSGIRQNLVNVPFGLSFASAPISITGIAFYKGFIWISGNATGNKKALAKNNGFNWEYYDIGASNIQIGTDIAVYNDVLSALVVDGSGHRAADYDDVTDSWSFRGSASDEEYSFLLNGNPVLLHPYDDEDDPSNAFASVRAGVGNIFGSATDIIGKDIETNPAAVNKTYFINSPTSEYNSATLDFDYFVENPPGQVQSRLYVLEGPADFGFSKIDTWAPGNRTESTYVPAAILVNNAPDGPITFNSYLTRLTGGGGYSTEIFVDGPGTGLGYWGLLAALDDWLFIGGPSTLSIYTPENDAYVASIDSASGSATWTVTITDSSGSASVSYTNPSFITNINTIASNLITIMEDQNLDDRFKRLTFQNNGTGSNQNKIYIVSYAADYNFSVSITVTANGSVTDFTDLITGSPPYIAADVLIPLT